MANDILCQITDIGNSMTTMRDNLRVFQDDMTRRFNSLDHSTNRRLDALEADISNNRFGPLRQRVTEFQETIEQRFDALDANLGPRFNDIDQSIGRLEQSTCTRQQPERITQLLQDLGRQTARHRQEIGTIMNERTDALRNHFDTNINRFETRLNARSDALRNHFDVTINQFETRLNTRSDVLRNRFDTTINQLEIRSNPRLDTLRVRVDTIHTTIRQLEESCTAVHQRLVT
jgi:DNA anti-recombination protein RmuC